MTADFRLDSVTDWAVSLSAPVYTTAGLPVLSVTRLRPLRENRQESPFLIDSVIQLHLIVYETHLSVERNTVKTRVQTCCLEYLIFV